MLKHVIPEFSVHPAFDSVRAKPQVHITLATQHGIVLKTQRVSSNNVVKNQG
jgi:hypothetical protein